MIRTAFHASASTYDDSRRSSVPQHPEDLEQHQTLPTGVHPRQCLVHRGRSHSPGKPTAPNNHRPSLKSARPGNRHATHAMIQWIRKLLSNVRIDKIIMDFKTGDSKSWLFTLRWRSQGSGTVIFELNKSTSKKTSSRSSWHIHTSVYIDYVPIILPIPPNIFKNFAQIPRLRPARIWGPATPVPLAAPMLHSFHWWLNMPKASILKTEQRDSENEEMLTKPDIIG